MNYAGLGAVQIQLFSPGGPGAACMSAALAQYKATGVKPPANYATECLKLESQYSAAKKQQEALTASGGGSTLLWVGLGIVLVGGAAVYYFKFRKPS